MKELQRQGFIRLLVVAWQMSRELRLDSTALIKIKSVCSELLSDKGTMIEFRFCMNPNQWLFWKNNITDLRIGWGSVPVQGHETMSRQWKLVQARSGRCLIGLLVPPVLPVVIRGTTLRARMLLFSFTVTCASVCHKWHSQEHVGQNIITLLIDWYTPSLPRKMIID